MTTLDQVAMLMQTTLDIGDALRGDKFKVGIRLAHVCYKSQGWSSHELPAASGGRDVAQARKNLADLIRGRLLVRRAPCHGAVMFTHWAPRVLLPSAPATPPSNDRPGAIAERI